MGVHGLWELVKPAAVCEPIEDYFMREGFERRRRGERVYRLGIDASIWFHQVQNTFAVGHAQSGENPELRTLFFRLARLLRLPVHAMFVFDGPGRPAMKRGRRVIPTSHWMVGAMRCFIEAFGYEYWTAPGEAEAELATLNQLGFIDGVLTDDSDALLFGAQTVIRNFDSKTRTLTVTHAEAVLTHGTILLSRPGMILIALLSGGDYNEGGLPGCGPRIALGLAHYQFGETLCQMVRERHPDALPQLLSDWRNELRHTLRSDPQKILGRQYHRLSTQIPDTFPDPNIVSLYINPVMSPFEDFEMNPPQPPNIAKLGALCERYFSWGTTPGIIERFGNCVLPGVVVRLLINRAVNHDRRRATMDVFEDILEPLVHISFDGRRRRSQDTRSVVVADVGFNALSTSALLGLRPSENTPRHVASQCVSIPKVLAQHMYDLVGGSVTQERKLRVQGLPTRILQHNGQAVKNNLGLSYKAHVKKSRLKTARGRPSHPTASEPLPSSCPAPTRTGSASISSSSRRQPCLTEPRPSGSLPCPTEHLHRPTSWTTIDLTLSDEETDRVTQDHADIIELSSDEEP